MSSPSEAAADGRWHGGWLWRPAPQRRASQRLRDVLDQLRLELSLRRRPVSAMAWPREEEHAWRTPDHWQLSYENQPPPAPLPAWAGGARGAALGGAGLLLLLGLLKLLDHCYTRVMQGRSGRSTEWSTSAVAINNPAEENTDTDPMDFDPFGMDGTVEEDFPPPYSECSSHKNVDRPPPYAECVVNLDKEDDLNNSNTPATEATGNAPENTANADVENTDRSVNDTGQNVNANVSGEVDNEIRDVLIRIERLQSGDVVNV